MAEFLTVLSECRRVLKSEGIIRIAVPSLEKHINAYVNKNITWFKDFPIRYKSLGGRFFNSILCDSQHKIIFDFSFLEEALESNDFRKIGRVSSGKSIVFPEHVLRSVESEDLLIVEAGK